MEDTHLGLSAAKYQPELFYQPPYLNDLARSLNPLSLIGGNYYSAYLTRLRLFGLQLPLVPAQYIPNMGYLNNKRLEYLPQRLPRIDLGESKCEC